MARKILLTVVACHLLVLFLIPVAPVRADYPDRPIRVVTGWAPGGSGDLPPRAICMAASKIIKQPIVVENMAGASGTKSLAVLTNAAPDGYYIGFVTTNTIVERPHVMEVQFDPIKGFTPIIFFGWYTYGLAIRADSPWKNVKDLVDYAKANPGKVKYGNSGAKSTTHIIAERFQMTVPGLKMVAVPFTSTGQAITALLGKDIDCLFGTPEYKPFVDAKQVRMIAAVNNKRWDSYPNVPTLIEQGYPVAAEGAAGMIGPPNLPTAIVTRLQDTFHEAMKDKDFLETMKNMELIPDYMSGADFGKFLKNKYAEIGQVVKMLPK
jgi:tripartite-type tricarboxylate transporter receptor subunit TctC